MLPLALIPTFILALSATGDTRCPSPEQVLRALRSEPAHSESATADLRLELRGGESGLTVALRNAEGRLLTQRELRGASCEGLAKAAAVVVLAWEAQLPVRTNRLPAVYGATDASLPVVDIEASSRPPSFERPRAPLRTEVDLSVGAAGAFGLTFAGATAVRLSQGETGWQTAFTAFVPLQRSFAVGQGRVFWWRPTAALGGGYGLRLGPTTLDGLVSVGGTLIVARGEGFTTNGRAVGLQPSLLAGLRWRWAGHGLRPALGVSATFFPLPQVLRVTGDEQSAGLTRAELFLTLGISWAG